MSQYPGGLDLIPTNKVDDTPTHIDHPGHHNLLADAVNKLETELGISPKGADADVSHRLERLDAAQSLNVILAPGVVGRNIIQPTDPAVEALTLRGNVGQTANVFSIQKSDGTQNRLFVDKDGNLGLGNGATFGGGQGVIGLADAVLAPPLSPAGVAMWSSSGILNIMGSGGKITKIGQAAMSLTADSAGIEIGNSVGAAGTPFIDFHYGTGVSQDYNFRFINAANNKLQLVSADAGAFAEITGSASSSSTPRFYITHANMQPGIQLQHTQGNVGNTGAFQILATSNITSTDATTPTTNINAGFKSLHNYGDGVTFAKGTTHNFTAQTVVVSSGFSTNEHACYVAFMRYDDTGATPGRAWMTDFNLHGAIAAQQDALNGINMFINNYYNGQPAQAASGAMWIQTKNGNGGGASSAHLAATTYPVGVGLGIVGTANGGSTAGYNTGIQVGGSGGPWGITTSRFGTGIEVRDYLDFGIKVSARDAGGTGPAIAVASGVGPVLIGKTAASFTTTLLEVQKSGTNDPLVYISGTASTDNLSLQVANTSGSYSAFVAGGASVFVTGTAAGDAGIKFASGKKFWIGAGSTAMLSIDGPNRNYGFGIVTYGGGAGVFALANAATLPTTNPTGGGILYVDAGALKYRGSGGTVTTLGPA